jgi:hypothetical protein
MGDAVFNSLGRLLSEALIGRDVLLEKSEADLVCRLAACSTPIPELFFYWDCCSGKFEQARLVLLRAGVDIEVLRHAILHAIDGDRQGSEGNVA